MGSSRGREAAFSSDLDRVGEVDEHLAHVGALEDSRQRLRGLLQSVPDPLPAPLSAFAGPLGHTGLTAYLGIDIGRQVARTGIAAG